MPPKPFKLYRLKDIDYDAVVAKYRELCEEGELELDVNSISMFPDIPSEERYIVKRKPRSPLRSDDKILNKALYLIHTIAYRQQTDREGNDEGISLQVSVLKDVIGVDEYELMNALVGLGYIKKSNRYLIGKSSRRYKVVGDITCELSSNWEVLKYIDRTKDILRNNILKALSSDSFIREYGDKFADTYVRNLNRFVIEDKIGFRKFAESCILKNPDTAAYYDFIEDGFKNSLKIYSIDDNNRIYHILTSLKRELKQYINIRFSIDCSNSHPLLFSYFIFLNKNISISDSYHISSLLSSISESDNNHYDGEKLRNVLKNNNIQDSVLAELEDDTLLYLWKTINGLFWDDVLLAHQDDGLDRAEIKQKMFAEVFYSKTPKIAWKDFAKEFKSQYPNVYELILKWKEPLRHKETKEVLIRRHKAVDLDGRVWMADESTALPNIMMDLESVIFRDILKSLFKKRICAVHIHDAIVVPKLSPPAKVTADDIISVMRDVYKRFGLHPSFKVE